MKLELVVRKDVSHVELVNDERGTLGIAIRDGMADEAGPVIKRIKAKSVADRSYAIAEGDVILSVNGREVMGARGKDILWMFDEIGTNIDINVQYEIREPCVSRSGVYRKYLMTTKLQKMGGNFGFVLRKKNSRHPAAVEYPLISNIKPGGPADKDGLMQDGDRLLKVDDVNLSWMSLPDIAIVLQERDEAKFTFEYNIRVLDFSKPEERKIELLIDIPIMDLGIGFCTHPVASHEMCIGSIRKGSVAERCGIFCEGDIILSVNGIDVAYLNVSKANSLLRFARKNRKISFLSTKGIELSSLALHGKYSSTPNEQSPLTSSSSIGIQATDYKHPNTPANSNSTGSIRSKSHLQFCPREQVKAIKKFQDAMKHMTDLKQSLSRLTCQAFDANNPFYMVNEICTCCYDTQYSVKLCASCLAKMNVKCAESMDVLRNIIAHFVAVSIDSKSLLPPNDSINLMNDIYQNPSESGVSRNLIHSLTKTLPSIYDDEPELKKSFKDLSEKIFNADTSCNSCKSDINFVSVTVQKLLLLISLNANTTEIKDLINQLVHLLLETKFACEGDANTSQSSEDNESRPETLRHVSPELSSMDGTSSSKATLDLSPNIVGPKLNVSESDEYENSNNDLNEETLIVNQDKESLYFRITHIQNSSESANDLDDIYEVNVMNVTEDTPLVNDDSSLKSNALENPTTPMNSEVLSKIRKMYKNKVIARTPAKVWKSLDSFLNLKKSPQNRSVVSRNDPNSSKQNDHRNTDERNSASGEVSFTNVQPRSSVLESNHPSKITKRNHSESNTDSTASSCREPIRNRGSSASEKIRRETVDVKLVNDGKGFGYVLGFSSPNFSQTLPVPIITAIKPKSPAERVGTLQKKDRVLAIDHKSIVNIPLKELENLKRRVFNSDQVILTIEFDVIDAPIKFGTFDVLLDKGLKIGLVFPGDIDKGLPLLVKGVVKGSAAYRSGQLFPGDKVSFLKCFRQEEFDPIAYRFSKEEAVTVTVQRDPCEGVKESPIKSFSSHSNPLSSSSRPNHHSGVKFILKRTSIRSVERTDSLVLEQEVTLFRDPISWDFGFLVGENPETGRAYVTDVRPGGPASASGVIKKFDRIMEVNGVAVDKSEECSVLSLLTQANDKIDLLIRRLYHEEMNNATLKASRF